VAELSKLKGRYELKESLGHGGMGVVYRAYDTVLKCDVAVKTIRDTPDPTALQLFYRECEVLAALNHPNIVQILDLGEFEQEGHMYPYFVMPLLPGSTLDRLIKGSNQLTIERSVDVLTQVCRGLGAAHERGLVHRDLKPGNIFVMPDDSVEIIDFGVAHMTSTGSTVGQKGTLLFMAPELLEMKPPSPLSDIFALGVMAYQMFTRRRPFERSSEREIIEAIMHEIPPPATDIDSNVNQGISRVLHKAMAKQPWHRFSTAREFAESLQKAHRGEAIDSFDPSRIRPRVERAKKAFEQSDYQFASEILIELEAEGHLDPQMAQLRRQIDVAVRQKRVQQLLESARTRLEEDEYPLALQKVQEALSLEPENAEALGLKTKIESTSSEHQIEGWFRLVRQHIDNNAYSHAREALRNVLQMRPDDTRAQSLLAEVDRLEQEHVRARKEKETLYQAALEEYQMGEVSSALGKLEKVLEIDRKAPDRSSTDRGATYQNFYNEVRSEYDSMRNSYAEARKHLEDQNFAKALAICDQFLSKFPGHALFQALKFDVEERQRQRLSSFIAEVDRQVEAEPDLERKVNILEEALTQFVQEPHFESSLKLIRSRLSLVNSIVSKARYHEERSQFSEALGQWEILKTIHGKYPGLDFETERLVKRREQQARLEAKARWVETIDGNLDTSEFDKAREAVQRALQEFPEDGELLALQKQAGQGMERQSEAQRALTEGNDLFTRGDFEAGIAVLKKARELDQRNPAIRSALAARLIERARQMLESDWRAAGELVDQALELEPANAAAKSLRILLEDRRREEFVDQAVAQIRELQTAGNLAAALAQVEQSLSFFPSEQRLMRLKASLTGALSESDSARTQKKDLEQLRGLAAGAQLLSEPNELQQVLDLMSKIASNYPLDSEFQTLLEGVNRRLKSAAMLRPATPQAATIVSPQAATTVSTHAATIISTPPQPPAAARSVSAAAVNAPPSEMGAATTIFVNPGAAAAPPPRPPQAASPLQATPPPQPPTAPPLPVAPNTAPKAAPKVVTKPAPASGGASWMTAPWFKFGAPAVLVLFIALGAWLALQPKKKIAPAPTTPTAVYFEIRTSPPGATILMGATTLGASSSQLHLPPGKYQLTARKDGYQPVTIPVDLQAASPSPFNVTLNPLPASLHLFTPFNTGNLYLDDKPSETLPQGGQLAITPLEPGKHTLRIESGASKASISFEVQPLTLPVVNKPEAKGIDAVAIATFRDQAALASSQADLPVLLDSHDSGKLVGGQATLKELMPGSHTLAVGGWNGSLDAGPAPAMNIFLGSLASQGKLFIDVKGAEDAHIFVNGAERGIAQKGRYGLSLDPGDYEIKVARDGFFPAKPQRTSVQKGGGARLSFVLLPKPVAAPAPLPAELPLPPKLQGSVTVEVSPPNSEVRYARSGDSIYQSFHLPSMELDAGSYVFVARAPGHLDQTRTVEVAAGGSQPVRFSLPAVKTAVVAPTTLTHTMAAEDWDKPWKKEDVWYTRQGGDFILYKIAPTAGTFNFAISPRESKGGLFGGSPKVRWMIDYLDPKNYIEFEIDKQTFASAEYRNGKKTDHAKRKPHGVESSSFVIQMLVDPGRVVVQIRSGDNWEPLDQWNESGHNYADGRFGFRLPNQDQMYLTDFRFTQPAGNR
jgi:serine/threonine protein kinase